MCKILENQLNALLLKKVSIDVVSDSRYLQAGYQHQLLYIEPQLTQFFYPAHASEELKHKRFIDSQKTA